MANTEIDSFKATGLKFITNEHRDKLCQLIVKSQVSYRAVGPLVFKYDTILHAFAVLNDMAVISPWLSAIFTKETSFS